MHRVVATTEITQTPMICLKASIQLKVNDHGDLIRSQYRAFNIWRRKLFGVFAEFKAKMKAILVLTLRDPHVCYASFTLTVNCQVIRTSEMFWCSTKDWWWKLWTRKL